MQQIVTQYRRKLSGAVTETDDYTRASNMADSTRVLIVDSDAAASASLESMLHAAGYSQTRIADSGNAAFAIAPVFLPSVAFLEIELRDMTGYDVARSCAGNHSGRACV